MTSKVSCEFDLCQELRGFDRFGAKTAVFSEENIPYYVNEFWTARQRQAHSLHEVSYRACFKPQLPEFFISRLTKEGDGVYDPFMGRGTTLVQASLQGRRPIGVDVNPICAMIARPRLAPPSIGDVENRLLEIDWNAGADADENEALRTFFHQDTLRQICALRAHLRSRLSQVDEWIRMVALNRLTGHSPGFFSVYTLPPNQAASLEAQKKINQRREQSPPRRDVPALILRKSRALLKDPCPRGAPDAVLLVADARNALDIPSQSAQLAVTSPPFLDVVDYRADNWLRCWFADIDIKTLGVSQFRHQAQWSQFVRDCFIDLARIVKPGGHVAFEVGEVRRGALPLERLVWSALEGLPFERLFVLVNAQRFTKTSNCWGVDNNSKGTNSNRIVVARRR